MPLPDPKAGSFFVWLVTCFLFLAIIGGGGFLLLYMTHPETESTSWFPVAGVVLVCLPWFFWFLTLFYRIVSRVFGVRIGGGGGGGGRGGGGGGGNVGKTTGDLPTAATNADYSVSPGSNERHVHFGAAVVVDEQEGNGNQQGKDGNQSNRNSLSSTNSNNVIFYTSHESERPLALSMAS